MAAYGAFVFFSNVASLSSNFLSPPSVRNAFAGFVVLEVGIPKGGRRRSDQVLKGGIFPSPESRPRPEKIMWSPPMKTTRYWSAPVM